MIRYLFCLAFSWAGAAWAGEQTSGALVDLSANPGLQIELAYKSRANFTGQSIYPENARAWADVRVAHALERVTAILEAQGLRLVIYDAYRPKHCARTMWNIAKSKGLNLSYLADPNQGSDHSRGAALDVGLVHTDGSKVAMPSPFDYFGPAASHEYLGASPQETANRITLRRAMETAGFRAHREEWWHYVLPAARYNPLMDVEM